jgi:hypothetical protein
MGFLDNLEDSLKSLENTEERDPNVQQRRQDERSRALAVAPWAEKLKTSDFTKKLFDEAALAGHRMRAKVYMVWFESTLRMEVKQRTLELRPTAKGIVAAFIQPEGETTEPLDLNSDPKALLDKWLKPILETSQKEQ